MHFDQLQLVRRARFNREYIKLARTAQSVKAKTFRYFCEIVSELILGNKFASRTRLRNVHTTTYANKRAQRYDTVSDGRLDRDQLV